MSKQMTPDLVLRKLTEAICREATAIYKKPKIADPYGSDYERIVDHLIDSLVVAAKKEMPR